jgi:GYF domain 2
MYKILGADQREYGPVSADDIRQWIAEGRANGATQAQAEGSSEWRPLSSFAEFNDALAAKPPPPAPEAPPAPTDPAGLAEYIRTRDFSLDIGACVSRSWELLKENFGLLLGATVIFLVLIVAFNQLLGLLTRPAMQSLFRGEFAAGPILLIMLVNIPEMALSAVLSGGYYILLLKLVRGQPAGIGNLFAGFGSSFLQLALAGIVVQILSMLGFLACLVPGIYLSVAWILTMPLIADRHLDFWTAMELSRKVVTRHWWMMFCLLAVMALISLAGLLACCVGILVAVPLGLGALIFAYEDIFARPGASAR